MALRLQDLTPRHTADAFNRSPVVDQQRTVVKHARMWAPSKTSRKSRSVSAAEQLAPYERGNLLRDVALDEVSTELSLDRRTMDRYEDLAEESLWCEHDPAHWTEAVDELLQRDDVLQ